MQAAEQEQQSAAWQSSKDKKVTIQAAFRLAFVVLPAHDAVFGQAADDQSELVKQRTAAAQQQAAQQELDLRRAEAIEAKDKLRDQKELAKLGSGTGVPRGIGLRSRPSERQGASASAAGMLLYPTSVAGSNPDRFR